MMQLKHLPPSLGLTEDDLKEMLPSGLQRTFVNRIGWATTYMKKANLLESTRRGYYRITPRGQELLRKKPAIINVKILKQYPRVPGVPETQGNAQWRENDHRKRISRRIHSNTL